MLEQILTEVLWWSLRPVYYFGTQNPFAHMDSIMELKLLIDLSMWKLGCPGQENKCQSQTLITFPSTVKPILYVHKNIVVLRTLQLCWFFPACVKFHFGSDCSKVCFRKCKGGCSPVGMCLNGCKNPALDSPRCENRGKLKNFLYRFDFFESFTLHSKLPCIFVPTILSICIHV